MHAAVEEELLNLSYCLTSMMVHQKENISLVHKIGKYVGYKLYI